MNADLFHLVWAYLIFPKTILNRASLSTMGRGGKKKYKPNNLLLYFSIKTFFLSLLPAIRLFSGNHSASCTVCDLPDQPRRLLRRELLPRVSHWSAVVEQQNISAVAECESDSNDRPGRPPPFPGRGSVSARVNKIAAARESRRTPPLTGPQQPAEASRCHFKS